MCGCVFVVGVLMNVRLTAGRGLRLGVIVMLLRWRLLEVCRMRGQRRRCVEDKRRSSRRDVTLVGDGGAFQLGSAPPAARLLPLPGGRA